MDINSQQNKCWLKFSRNMDCWFGPRKKFYKQHCLTYTNNTKWLIIRTGLNIKFQRTQKPYAIFNKTITNLFGVFTNNSTISIICLNSFPAKCFSKQTFCHYNSFKANLFKLCRRYSFGLGHTDTLSKHFCVQSIQKPIFLPIVSNWVYCNLRSLYCFSFTISIWEI